MENIININEYVRTREGKIYKTNITMINDTSIKHSPNIINVIERYDYVNGYIVEGIDQGGVLVIDDSDNGYSYISVNQIKSIVTKEQFEQMKYIVGDESNVKD